MAILFFAALVVKLVYDAVVRFFAEIKANQIHEKYKRLREEATGHRDQDDNDGGN